jgi:Ca2+-binding EF-hand superfamily protein
MLRQMMRLVLPVFVGTTANFGSFAATLAPAASPGEALRSFGLVGTWSADCAVPLGTLGASRITYEVQDDGRATFTSTFTTPIPGRPQSSVVYQIDDASILSDKQIKLVAKIVARSCPGCQTAPLRDASQQQIIVEKVDSQIHIVDSRSLVGTSVGIEAGVMRATGKPAPLESKCAAGSPPQVAATSRNPLPAPQMRTGPVGRLMSPKDYLLARLNPNMTLDAYLKRMNGEFRMADADANGEISAADAMLLAQIASANFRTMFLAQFLPADLDGDGGITEDEVRRWWKYRQISSDARLPTGKTVDEIIQDKVREIMALDTDHDGRITFTELLNHAKTVADVGALGGQSAYQLMALAPEGKSVLTRSDLEMVVQQLFRDVDTDGDGVVSIDELQSYRASHTGNAAH